MKHFTKEEYIELLEYLTNHQYDLEEPEKLEEKIDCTPIEPRVKKKLLSNHNLIDLTMVRREKLKDLILDHKNIIVGPFKISITCPRRQLTDTTVFSISIWEEEKGSKIIRKVDVQSDDRFGKREWKKYFSKFKTGNNIPEDDLVDIVRWLQAIHKLTAFL